MTSSAIKIWRNNNNGGIEGNNEEINNESREAYQRNNESIEKK